MPLSKPFLHAIKLHFPYQNQINRLSKQFNVDYEKAWYSLLSKGKVRGNPLKEWANLQLSDIKTVAIDEAEYPYALKEISDPPTLLYYRGALPPEALNLAIVGSRKISSYGTQAVNTIIRPLALQKINIISGLAHGVDAHAHQKALELQLKTFAILGSGIDQLSVYPSQNRDLAIQIIKAGGGLISELPPGSPATAANFPMRNRIISGLSQAIIIVEATYKSGGLITGKLALEQNRDIFAVPGNIFDAQSEGTNHLLKLGAKVITSGQDILDEYALKNIQIPQLPIGYSLSEIEKKVLSCLTIKAIHFNEIIKRSELSASQVNTAVIMLELKEIISTFPGQRYALNLTVSSKSG
ncbi:MAG: protecting protein DprA, processing protein [Candidatus Doudnabacteria bacterium]|nr:protecting protein DprA, processing protein [Candidatus Doudnabacteria bacterium]